MVTKILILGGSIAISRYFGSWVLGIGICFLTVGFAILLEDIAEKIDAKG